MVTEPKTIPPAIFQKLVGSNKWPFWRWTYHKLHLDLPTCIILKEEDDIRLNVNVHVYSQDIPVRSVHWTMTRTLGIGAHALYVWTHLLWSSLPITTIYLCSTRYPLLLGGHAAWNEKFVQPRPFDCEPSTTSTRPYAPINAAETVTIQHTCNEAKQRKGFNHGLHGHLDSEIKCTRKQQLDLGLVLLEKIDEKTFKAILCNWFPLMSLIITPRTSLTVVH